VLQNKKYIQFAQDNTVEVISLSRLDEGIKKEDRRAATYDAKDESGNDVKYLLEFPGMTVEEMYALNRSKAGTYNQTGKIPYTALVNPHTLEQMQFWSGGQGAGTIMDAVTEQKAVLNKEYGPSTRRSDLLKFNEDAQEVREVLAKRGCVKAFSAYKKLAKSLDDSGEALKAKGKALFDEIVAASSKDLDEAARLIEEGDGKKAVNMLRPLARALEGTELEERCNELFEKAKALG
jgi:hypothetical protein